MVQSRKDLVMTDNAVSGNGTGAPLRGLAAIVTGGGSGIGRATARRFADEGAGVLVVGRTRARLDETAVGRSGIRCLAADITAPGGPAQVVAAALAAFGRVDVLVNNAAIRHPAALGSIDRESAERQFATNLLTPIFLTQQVLPHITSGGVVVNVTSNPPDRGWPDSSVYGASKVALDFLTRTWALELAPRGIRVVSVAPGVTEAPLLVNAGFTPEQVEARGRANLHRIPLRRHARPEEIAWWIVNVTRPEAGYLTGAVIRVDGGISVA
jgi:NAD(P)-dependent dehydrogenase (short-subunit alcohol dehydrogenase family)